MTSVKAPVLPDQYHIKTGLPGVSIDEQVAAALEKLEKHAAMVKLLGSYPQAVGCACTR